MYEFIHALHFLSAPQLYRFIDFHRDGKLFSRILHKLWPSLRKEHDGLNVAEIWDFRFTELLAAIGKEDPKSHGIAFCFSGLLFKINDERFRFPYANLKVTISVITREQILCVARKNFLDLMKS